MSLIQPQMNCLLSTAAQKAVNPYLEQVNKMTSQFTYPITYSSAVVEFLEDSDAVLQAVPVGGVKHLQGRSEVFLLGGDK